MLLFSKRFSMPSMRLCSNNLPSYLNKCSKSDAGHQRPFWEKLKCILLRKMPFSAGFIHFMSKKCWFHAKYVALYAPLACIYLKYMIKNIKPWFERYFLWIKHDFLKIESFEKNTWSNIAFLHISENWPKCVRFGLKIVKIAW